VVAHALPSAGQTTKQTFIDFLPILRDPVVTEMFVLLVRSYVQEVRPVTGS
jgi:hypothetical protein